MHSILWCCASCGFVIETGQPHMECPICEAYKANFVDAPAHIEAAIRERFGDAYNSAEARAARLDALREGNYLRRFRLKGRFTYAVDEPRASRTTT